VVWCYGFAHCYYKAKIVIDMLIELFLVLLS